LRKATTEQVRRDQARSVRRNIAEGAGLPVSIQLGALEDGWPSSPHAVIAMACRTDQQQRVSATLSIAAIADSG